MFLHSWWAITESPRTLKLSDFGSGGNPNCVVYVEHGSKNRSGGLSDQRVENKEVPCYAVSDNIPKDNKDILYLRPKKYTRGSSCNQVYTKKHQLVKKIPL